MSTTHPLRLVIGEALDRYAARLSTWSIGVPPTPDDFEQVKRDVLAAMCDETHETHEQRTERDEQEPFALSDEEFLAWLSDPTLDWEAVERASGENAA